MTKIGNKETQLRALRGVKKRVEKKAGKGVMQNSGRQSLGRNKATPPATSIALGAASPSSDDQAKAMRLLQQHRESSRKSMQRLRKKRAEEQKQ
jgi:hypothetical protein